MQELAAGWMIETQRGPDWLFVQLQASEEQRAEGNELADSLWSLLEQHFTYRLVLELDRVEERVRGMDARGELEDFVADNDAERVHVGQTTFLCATRR